MDIRQFLALVLSPTGRYCLFTVKHSNSTAIREARTQTFFDSIGDLAQAALTSDAMHLDTYFAVGTVGEEDNRKAYNILEFRSIFLDIDCGEGKDYPNKVTALRALNSFCKHYKLPRPLIVDSGNGIHVYWLLTNPVTVQEWKPVAERLKRACKQFGLKADEQVTADVARILRVPETHNHKSDPIPVKVIPGPETPPTIDLLEFDTKLGGAGTLMPVSNLPANLSRKLDPLTEHYTKNVECSFKKILQRTKAGDGCAQIAHRIKTRSEATYDEWTQMLALAWQCVDRDKAIQVVSSGHPDYDADAVRAKAETFDGPTLCTTFEATTSGLCAGCPHQNRIKSPIQLGKIIATSSGEVAVQIDDTQDGEHIPAKKQVVIPEYPKGFQRGKNGGVYVPIFDEDGNTVEQKMLYRYDLYIHATMKYGEGYAAVVHAHSPHDGLKEFQVPTEHITSVDELRKHLSRNQVLLTDWKAGMFYLKAFLEKIESEKRAIEAREQFGWNNTYTEFTWGDWTYRKHKDPVPNLPTKLTAPYIAASRPTGDKAVYDSRMHTFNYERQEAHRYAICSSFGAPLMAFTGINMSSKCFWATDSGSGKTAAMYAAVGAFGHPKLLELKAKDTHNANQILIQMYKNMLVPLDEVEIDADSRHLSKMVYENSDGRIKNRMRQNGNEMRSRGEPWHTQMVCTANGSIIDKISAYKPIADAESQRMMEISMPILNIVTPEEGMMVIDDLEHNYGHYSGIYLQHIVDHADSIKKQIIELRLRLIKAANLTASNRFWSADAATTLMGGLIAKKLGIVPFDMNELFNWTVRMLIEHRERVEMMKGGDSAQDILSRFINEHNHGFLTLKSTDDKRGERDPLDVIVPYSSPRSEVVGRWEVDTDKIFLSVSALKTWCARVAINYSDLRRKANDELKANVKGIRKRLTKGTHHASGPVAVWQVSAAKLQFEVPVDESSPSQSNSA